MLLPQGDRSSTDHHLPLTPPNDTHPSPLLMADATAQARNLLPGTVPLQQAIPTGEEVVGLCCAALSQEAWRDVGCRGCRGWANGFLKPYTPTTRPSCPHMLEEKPGQSQEYPGPIVLRRVVALGAPQEALALVQCGVLLARAQQIIPWPDARVRGRDDAKVICGEGLSLSGTARRT